MSQIVNQVAYLNGRIKATLKDPMALRSAGYMPSQERQVIATG